jgi:hypothetical protein
MYRKRNKNKDEQTASASKYPQGYFKVKPCNDCSNEFIPTAPSEKYCSDKCKDRGIQSAYLKRNYKIDVDTYEKMLKEQKGLCKICEQPNFKMSTCHTGLLVVDHCHTTGVVRGLLCHNCNRGLGLFQDNPENLIKASEYLKVQRLS